MSSPLEQASVNPWPLDANRPFVAGTQPRGIVFPEPRGGWKGLVKRLVADALLPVARQMSGRSQGFCVYTSWGGLGDEVLHTAILRQLSDELGGRFWVLSLQGWVYQGHPAVKGVIPPDGHVFAWLQRRGLQARYGGYTKVRDSGRSRALRHQIAMMCEEYGLKGSVELRPELHLSERELAHAKSYENCMVVHSSVLGARFASYNKQWPLDRMAEVVKGLRKNHRVVQIGGGEDPALPGAEDLRGCRDLRHVSAILANAELFVGMEGFHTHLARAVNCRSVVIYGGYTHPKETGYPCNENIYTELSCSPCWEPSGCNFKRKCLDVISPNDVLDAVEKALAKKGQELETEKVQLLAAR